MLLPVITIRRIAALSVWLIPAPALHASFHFMQVEQVMAGVEGDVAAQAIQLRMRSNGQEQVQLTRLIVRDAAGENPITLIDLDQPVAVSATGARILIASDTFGAYTMPAAVPDFIMENLIPESYIAAGTMTFENDEGTLIVWRFSWGGAQYTGSTLGAQTNDDDGEFGPPYDETLPNTGTRAIVFDHTASQESRANATDYVLTAEAAVFTANNGVPFTVTPPFCDVEGAADQDADGRCDDEDNCPATENTDQSDRDGDRVGNACDICPDDPAKNQPGACGCGRSDLDVNGDGTPDCDDPANDPEPDTQPDDHSTDPDMYDEYDDGELPGDTGDHAQDDSLTDDHDHAADGEQPADPDELEEESGNGSGALPAPRACGAGMIAIWIIPLWLTCMRRR